jgi:uncharacterized protein (DUF58 family)
VTSRPTRDGGIALAGGLALLAVGLVSGNNLVYLVAAPIWSALVLSVPLGWWNLRHVEVRRILPAELYAGREAVGTLLVRNGRRRMAACALELSDEGTGAAGSAARVEVGGVAPVAARWRFGDRGPVRLTAVTVRSRWPFGLTEHALRLPLPAALVVYPRPLPATVPPRSWSGDGAEEQAVGHGPGELLGLRPYQPGDPPRIVHWATTARTGELYVAERAGEAEVSVEVDVRDVGRGASWERELSRATGEVQRALQLGRRVGMRLPAVGGAPGRTLPPASGGGWRRTLLEALARMPRR